MAARFYVTFQMQTTDLRVLDGSSTVTVKTAPEGAQLSGEELVDVQDELTVKLRAQGRPVESVRLTYVYPLRGEVS